jgi:hypothetical protein
LRRRRPQRSGGEAPRGSHADALLEAFPPCAWSRGTLISRPRPLACARSRAC